MIIHFTPLEMHTIVHYSAIIYETKKINKIKNEIVDPVLNQFGTHMIGNLGEAGLCKALDIPFVVDVNMGGDDGDDVLFKNIKLQVKTLKTDYAESNKLYFRDVSNVSSDILVGAAICSPTSVRLFGALPKEKYMQKMYKHNFGFGDCDCVDQHDLSTIVDMVDYLKKI
jgi:hypothetical protein